MKKLATRLQGTQSSAITVEQPIDDVVAHTSSFHNLPYLHPSHPIFTRAKILFIFGCVAGLGLVAALLLAWQSFNSAREVNRQKIMTALGDAVAGIQEQILIIEMTALSTEHTVRATCRDNPDCLRVALEGAVSAFEKLPELSHIGLILTEGHIYSNLERSTDGDILLWMPPTRGENADSLTQVLKLGETGFVPYARWPTRQDEASRLRSVQQMVLQGAKEGSWRLRMHPWVVHGGNSNPTWGMSYSKAIHDEAGRPIGVLDAHFDLSSMHGYMREIQTRYGIQLDVIELSEIPRMVNGDMYMPRPVPENLTPLLAGATDKFVDVMQINAERHWVAAQPLTLKGNVSWLVVASRLLPLHYVLSGEQLAWLLAIVLILTTATGLLLAYVMYRVGKIQGNRADAEYRHLITHDELTGLPNRTALQHRARTAIAEAQEKDALVALLQLNLDRFKAINDSYGYMFGNDVLRAVGETLVSLTRPQDMVAHLSGDRFLILLPDLHHRDEAHRLARRILDGLKRPVIVQSREINLGASIGASLFPYHGDTPNVLINNADIAMYEAKKAGLGALQFFNTEIGNKIQTDIDLEVRLHDAIKENQLYLLYQPKVNLRDGLICGCEALLRWEHPELGTIPPARFIPIAENAGLIVSIGDWVLKTACQQAKNWLDIGLSPACVAVNLSMRQFLRRDVVKWIADTLQNTGLPAHCLELEITESLLPQDMEKVINILNQLQALGVKLALDDFGTGYSNLSYLKQLRIHTLKIDQAFVRSALKSPQDAAIVRTVVDLAHNLGYKALAEGVETQEQLHFVQEQQCDEIQGYYFSRPVAPETYAIMLRDGITLKRRIEQTA